MYSNKLAVAIKTAGKVLREFEDQVYVPFGSEYSILVKNLNSVRASVRVSVDGEDVGDGRSFVVDANKSVDIERFIRNGNLDEGNRLKFIERTGSVEQHRGIGVEDGLIRVEFQYEKPAHIWFNEPHIYNDPPRPYGGDLWGGPFSDGTNNNHLKGMSRGICDSNQAFYSANIATAAAASCDFAETGEADTGMQNDAGITVPGSVSDQHFNEIAAFPLESETHVIVLKLLGQTENNKVTKPVTVKTKPKCVTCGRTNKANAKFCTNCGTALTIV